MTPEDIPDTAVDDHTTDWVAPTPAAASQWRTVVFLDVDGVLHSDVCQEMFEPAPMSHLEQIVRGSAAVVCLSSSWRCSSWGVAEVNTQLARISLAAVVDRTPLCGFATRSDEILHWLSQHPAVERWVALDDIDLTHPHGQPIAAHFVHTDPRRGLTQADADAALEKLQRPCDRQTLPAAQTAEEPRW